MGAEADVYWAVEVATSTTLSVAAVRAWLESLWSQAPSAARPTSTRRVPWPRT